VVRFRRGNISDHTAGRFGLYPHEHSVGKQLRRPGYCRLSVCPLNPKTDFAAQKTFKTNFASLAREVLGERAADQHIEI